MADEEIILENDSVQIEYFDSLLSKLNSENMSKIVRKIKNIEYKNRNQLQNLGDILFKYIHLKPEKIKEYVLFCVEIKDLKITLLRFEKENKNKETFEIAKLRFHLILATRVEIVYDQLNAIKNGYALFSQQMQQSTLWEVLKLVRNQLNFAGELYKHELILPELLLALINRLSTMTGIDEFFVECFVSLMEQTAKEVETKNISLGKFFKQLKDIVKENKVDNNIIKRIKALLKLRATKWLAGEDEVPVTQVERLNAMGDFKQKSRKAVVEELTRYISLDKCRSCCVEFMPSEIVIHLTSRQHTIKIQTLLRDQYDGNLISCRVRSCYYCQEKLLERPFHHFGTQKHKLNTTTYCYICQTKFTSAYFLSMHLRSFTHRKELITIYDSILGTAFLQEILAKQNDILSHDDSDNDRILLDIEKFDKVEDDDDTLKSNIYRYLKLLAEEDDRDKQELHEELLKQLEIFIENIYISKNISILNTLDLFKYFYSELDDIKIAMTCIKGELPVVSKGVRAGIMMQPTLANLLREKYEELFQDVQEKLLGLKIVQTGHQANYEPGESSLHVGALQNHEQQIDNTDTSENTPLEVPTESQRQSGVELVAGTDSFAMNTTGGGQNIDDYRNENYNVNSLIEIVSDISENASNTYHIDGEESIRDNTGIEDSRIISHNEAEHNFSGSIVYDTENICADLSYQQESSNELGVENMNSSTVPSTPDSSSRGELFQQNNESLSLSETQPLQETEDIPETFIIPEIKIEDEENNYQEIQNVGITKNKSSYYEMRKKSSRKHKRSKAKNKKKYKNKNKNRTLDVSGDIVSEVEVVNAERYDSNDIPNSSSSRRQKIVAIHNTSENRNSSNDNISSRETTSPVQSIAQQNPSPSQISRQFNLKGVKSKTFAKLKRQINEKFSYSEQSRSNKIHASKLANELINLIKKIYMPDDIPLIIIIEVFKNFNNTLIPKGLGQATEV